MIKLIEEDGFEVKMDMHTCVSAKNKQTRHLIDLISQANLEPIQ